MQVDLAWQLPGPAQPTQQFLLVPIKPAPVQQVQDQLHQGVPIILSQAKSPICPVTAVTAYMAVRGQAPGPFFRFLDTRPLTQERFISAVRAALNQLSLPGSDYACRIGAATTTAECGIED